MNDLFLKFISQLEDFFKKDSIPTLGDWNLRTYLDLQNKRLKEKGLTEKFSFKPMGKVLKIGDHFIGKLLNGYNKRVLCNFGERTREYLHNGKSIYKDTKQVSLYQLIIDANKENKDLKNETYVCPSCGAISKISELELNGCPFCHTQFIMNDLYPKVTNYYFLENIADKSFSFNKLFRLIKGCLKISLFFSIFLFGMSLFPEYAEGFSQLTELGFLYTLGYMFLGTFIWGLLFWPIVFQIADGIVVTKGMRGAKRKISKNLKKLDNNFSYDYFEGKVLSLLRMIIFADNPSKFIQYIGTDLDDSWKDIINIDYRGGLGVESIVQNNQYIDIKVNAYMKNTYCVNNKIKVKDEVITLTLRHNKEFKVNSKFSINKVECENCGSSFDALKFDKCPSCQSEYDSSINDWVITEIIKNKI